MANRPAGATTPAEAGGWSISSTVGTRFRLPVGGTIFEIVPGYALDVNLPVRVGAGAHASVFDPDAHRKFADSGTDLTDPSAAAVLEGRARASNAGTHFELDHTVTLNLRWTQRLP